MLHFTKFSFITNREVIKQFMIKQQGLQITKQVVVKQISQLANLLIAFEEEDYIDRHTDTVFRNDELLAHDKDEITQKQKDVLARDRFMAIGIAAGYVNLTASMLGYGTGCCACFDENDIAETIGPKIIIKLLMGVGFKNADKNRRVHLSRDFVFHKSPQEIETNSKSNLVNYTVR